MAWNLILVAEFEAWLLALSEQQRIRIATHLVLLRERGPALGRPYADTLKSNLPN
jgi:hypothetical protein